MKFTKQDIILAALSPKDISYDSIQLQKLLFLLDENVSPDLFGGKLFDFQPYNYGPFDKDVYTEMNKLSFQNLAHIDTSERSTKYALSAEGQKKGAELLNTLPKNYIKYIKDVNNFVTVVPFRELVSSIYKAYPRMKKNSIFFG